MNTQQAMKIITTIEHHVAAAKQAVNQNDTAGLEEAGDQISGLGDMLRDL